MQVITLRSGMAVANDAPAPVFGLQFGMLGKELRDHGLDRLRKQGACPVAQNLGELVVKGSCLNQSDNVIVGDGI